MKNSKKIFNSVKLLTLFLYSIILTFIIAFNFAHNPPSGWYQQFLPVEIGNAPLRDMAFTDSLTGYAVTDTSNRKSYILKTTNGGDNWNIIFTDSGRRGFTKLQFLNNYLGFAGTNYFTGGARLYKTSNGGISWLSLNGINTYFEYDDFTVLSEDTIWVTDNSAFDGGLYRTTNGGQNWEVNFYNTFDNPESIYMFNANFGFMFYHGSLYRTTNAGVNWNTNPGGSFRDIEFMDSLTGWKAYGDVKVTTNGGLNWTTQVITQVGGNIGLSSVEHLSFVNKDTIWGFGRSECYFPGSGYRGFIHKTTNGGLNWGYQIPLDTSIYITEYNFGGFVDSKKGWAYAGDRRGAHTVVGGNDTTYYTTSITQITTTTPSNYKLYQNYPNPYNPLTKIKYELKTTDLVKLIVFNIEGREVKTIVNERQNAGVYEADFSATEYGSSISSGVYFYSLFAGERLIDTKKMIVLK